MNKVWSDIAWDEYLYWQAEDKKAVIKINKLIKDIDRNGHIGIGKPERLSGKLSEYWSRRIDDANRLVYRIKDGNIEIAQCKGHYNDH